MLRNGDPGTDRPDTAAGTGLEQNQNIGTEGANRPISREELLAQDEEARKFFESMQKLRGDLRTLKQREILNVDVRPAVKEAMSEPEKAQQPGGGRKTDSARPQTATETAKAPAPSESAASAEASAPQPAADAETVAKSGAGETPKPAAASAGTVARAETDAPQPAAEAETAVKAPEAVVKAETTAPQPASDTETAAKAETAAPASAETPDPVVLDSAQTTAKSAFEERFRQQMESQMQEVQKAETEKAKQKAAKAARREAARREKAARSQERKEERRAKARKKQLDRELRAAVKRKKYLADQSAQMGGGIVNTHDTTVSTEIQPVARFSWRDLLGIVPLSEKRAAATEEELQTLKEEQERKTAEAREAAARLSKAREVRYRNSAVGKQVGTFKAFCDRHKTLLLVAMSMVLLVCVGAAGVINYCTAYEYSYNGHVLGYVKSKDQVLQITDMVQKALTEDKEIQVVIDAKDDITFRRVSLLDMDVTTDSSDEVLRRLTYMGDLNVKAYGIYVNGEKIGSVESKDAAADVLKMIEARYASDKSGTVIEKAEILETVDVKKGNTSLREVYSPDRMTELLCTSGHKETVHTVIAGETLYDIAKLYGTTEEKLVADNEGVDPVKLEVGSTLLVQQNAPVLTVRITEKRDYTRTIKYETIEKKTDEMFEDETEIEQEGKDGKEERSERTVSINGEVESKRTLSRVVSKKPVDKIVLIGTAERPPSVGDGVYIWPLAGGYTLTSHFGHRWGRLHAGIDLGTPTGNDVMAADGGIVVRAGYFGGYGYCVDIDHQNGQMTRYGHLSSILVSVGDEVYEGQHIAESGNTGASTGAHLHFEIHNNGVPHDPLQDLP